MFVFFFYKGLVNCDHICIIILGLVVPVGAGFLR